MFSRISRSLLAVGSGFLLSLILVVPTTAAPVHRVRPAPVHRALPAPVHRTPPTAHTGPFAAHLPVHRGSPALVHGTPFRGPVSRAYRYNPAWGSFARYGVPSGYPSFGGYQPYYTPYYVPDYIPYAPSPVVVNPLVISPTLVTPDTALGEDSTPLALEDQGVTDNRCQLEIVLPDPAAEVRLDGRLLEGAGSDRWFATPPLEPNQLYKYAVTARWQKGGQTVTENRTATVKAGTSVTVDFTRPASVAPTTAP